MMVILILILTLDICAAKFFNILSIDGGGIRGLIPAQAIELMETYAYEYAQKKGYTVPEYDDRPGRMAMKDLFEMTAGTSTGSIVAAALSYPKKDTDGKRTEVPLYWAKEIIDIYSLKGDQIFKRKSIGNFAAIFWLIIFLATFALAGYAIGHYTYTDPEIENAIEDFRNDLQIQRKCLKNKSIKESRFQSRTQKLVGVKVVENDEEKEEKTAS